MTKRNRARPPQDHRSTYETLSARWAELCRRYLPVAPADSIWRHSREPLPEDPEQGWKLHIPATVLTANRVLEAVGPVLSERGVLYKTPRSLGELDKLNSGIFYGYSQVGKFLTIYPRSDEEAVRLAAELHRLTRRIPAPSVPFDLKYGPGSRVHYRYGAFKLLTLEEGRRGSTYAIRDPQGRLIPDVRDSAAQPEWAADPFPTRAARAREDSPLKTTFRAFRALTQRGRGGVYHALDLSATPPRLCILKEGRRHGEVSWDGRDGRWRVRHEARVLELLRESGVDVPRVYASFEAGGNSYLATEFIEGESLERWLCRRRRRLPVAQALRRGAEVAGLLARVHAAGWVWRDCKPGNIVMDARGVLRALDFEGACPTLRPDPLPWGTPGFTAPEANAPFQGQSRLPEDLYALGAVVHLLLAGSPPGTPRRRGREPKRHIPEAALEVVADLLDPDPARRPAAHDAANRLKEALASLGARTRRPSRSEREAEAAREVREARVGA